MANEPRVNLIVLDGWGVSLKEAGNAIASARTPTYDYLVKHYPVTTLKASGISVGLSWHEPGNSEVGHMSMGTGRIIYQYLPRIISSIRDGTFFENEALLSAVKNVKENDSSLHLIGLLGSGSVHSYIDHLYALLDLAKLHEISDKVKLHLITDGRDSLPTEGAKFISQLQKRLEAEELGEIATVIGRFYALDRDLNWDRVQKAWELMVHGEGEKTQDVVASIEEAYDRDTTDSYLEPLVVTDEDEEPKGLISDKDSVIFWNYREDRARELTKAFVLPGEVDFEAEELDLEFVTLTQYNENFPVKVAFEPPAIDNTLAEVISEAGTRQARVAETEKYAHVTYFFNGTKEQSVEGEERQLVPSDDIMRFTDKPEMKAPEISGRFLELWEREELRFILVNFANADILAHTGNFDATVEAVQVLDKQLEKILQETESDPNCYTLIAADHGNAERMRDPYSGEKLTEHTTNNVPFILVHSSWKQAKDELEINKALRESEGLLSDVAPTVLDILGLEIPRDMRGSSLLKSLGLDVK